MKKFMVVLMVLVAITASFWSCAVDKEVQLISRDVLFGNPDKASLRLSPDGQHISYLAPVDGLLNVWVAPADDPGAAKAVTSDTLRGIRIYFWAYTNKHVIYLQDKGGDENWQVHVVDIETNEDRNLTPFEEIPGPDGEPMTLPNGKIMRPRADIQEVSHKFANEILIGLNNRNAQFFDIHKLDILTGDLQLIEQNDRFLAYMTDDDYNVRFAFQMTPDGGNQIFKKGGPSGWEPFEKIEMEDMMTTSPIAFDKSGENLYMIDSRGRNTAALTKYNIAGGDSEVLLEDERADIQDIMMHPTEKTVEAAAVEYTRVEWTVLDESIQADLDYLKTVTDGEINVTSRTLDDKKWAIAYTKDDGPVRYYLYDREAKKAQFMFTNRSLLEGLTLTKMHPVVIKSRDGLDLVSYLSLPAWQDQGGMPEKPLPMVLYVHGGPWARDSWGYSPTHQWLTNRGYAVLSVNYRGSTGFGKDFINASNLEWAGKMHDDLIDVVNWAVENNVAIKDSICIMGGSYGGYATLVGLTFTPDVFLCGVDIVGPSNLRTLLETIPPYWKPMMELWASRVGDPRTEEGRQFLDSRSPLTFVDEISKPLLIGQGANDPRVKQSESDQIVAAMEEKSIPVTYVLYSDEGHGFARPENRLSFYAVTDLFLAQHLGGRSEPVGDDFENSSIEILNGKDQIEGLSAE